MSDSLSASRGTSVPIIDIDALVRGDAASTAVAQQIAAACREHGFFYVVNHGVDAALQKQLEAESLRFFSKPEAEKMQIAMKLGGRAWRGFFPVGGELTSGKPDLKEGLYFGAELPLDHPEVKAQTPLHGQNLFPKDQPQFKAAVLAYMDAAQALGHTLMRGLSLSLGLAESYFADHYTRDPLILFRIFNYPVPATPEQRASTWGVGEHTDYGVLTILKQDDHGGLEVKTNSGWIQAPPVPGSFVCNIGDMLDRMTGGLYKSTPHRVRNASGRSRLSWPFFFDPGFRTLVKPLPMAAPSVRDDSQERWDKANVHAFQGTYGDYLLGKVGKVFPDLKQEVL